MKYEVSIDLIDYRNAMVIVEADSPLEAEKKAYIMDLDHVHFEPYDTGMSVQVLDPAEDDTLGTEVEFTDVDEGTSPVREATPDEYSLLFQALRHYQRDVLGRPVEVVTDDLDEVDELCMRLNSGTVFLNDAAVEDEDNNE